MSVSTSSGVVHPPTNKSVGWFSAVKDTPCDGQRVLECTFDSDIETSDGTSKEVGTAGGKQKRERERGGEGGGAEGGTTVAAAASGRCQTDAMLMILQCHITTAQEDSPRLLQAPLRQPATPTLLLLAFQ